MRVETCEVFVEFNSVENDRTQRGPVVMRRWAAPERVGAHCNMGEIAADPWASVIDQTAVVIQKRATLL